MAAASKQSVIHAALCLFLFFGALVGTAVFIGRKLPLQEIESVTAKISWLKKYGDKYDTLFLGSSRTKIHILPDEFDRLMAAAGHPTHSFNLGMSGLRPPEDNYVLETALSRRKTPLKYVFVESNGIRLDSALDRDAESLRKSYWLDPKRFQVITQQLLQLPENELAYRDGRWNMIFYNTRRFAKTQLNVGRGFDMVAMRFGKPPKSLKKTWGNEWQGWEGSRRSPKINSADWKSLEERVVDLKKEPVAPQCGTRLEQEQMREKRRLIEKYGGKMILFTPPLAYRQHFAPDPATMGDIPFLNFWNPQIYPELFERKNLQDLNHLNIEGAKAFTKVLVERFLELPAD